MSPVRLIAIDDAKNELRSYGWAPLTGKGKLNTAEWWCWPWGGAPFTLPIDENGKIDQWAFHRLLADMAKLAPQIGNSQQSKYPVRIGCKFPLLRPRQK